MIEFILNDQRITIEKSPGSTLLDFIRYDSHLMGTKIGCREGDCGACTVLEGSIKNGNLYYKSIVSCLTPLINAHGKHIVTIEGLNLEELSIVQKAMVENSATQCGFCTPGFVVALTGNMMSSNDSSALMSVSGNICRCTGYKSIEAAAEEVDEAKESLLKGDEIQSMIDKAWLPEYFAEIQSRLQEIPDYSKTSTSPQTIGGGTDLMVQIPDDMRNTSPDSVFHHIPNTITEKNGKIEIGAAVTIQEFFDSPAIQKYYPNFNHFYPLIASEQIRNMGTLAGNMVNASPIGDLSALFLALNAKLIMDTGRKLALKDFFLDYKKTDLNKDELIQLIEFEIPNNHQKINFEKVSKRTYLDIASVNSACSISLDGDLVNDIHLSLGGIAAYPLFMARTCDFLKSKELNSINIKQALSILQSEISPISDIRGSSKYKRQLSQQLFLNHIRKLYPEKFTDKDILELSSTKINAL